MLRCVIHTLLKNAPTIQIHFEFFFRIAEVDNACENNFGGRVALDNPNGLADPVIAGNPMGSLIGIY